MKELKVKYKINEFSFKIDDADYEDAIQFKWFVTANGYKSKKGKQAGVYLIRKLSKDEQVEFGSNVSHEYLHRRIVKCPIAKVTDRKMVVDHIDCDTYNLQKANLRLTTQSINFKNGDGYGIGKNQVRCLNRLTGESVVVDKEEYFNTHSLYIHYASKEFKELTKNV